jgi:hypothetical protein
VAPDAVRRPSLDTDAVTIRSPLGRPLRPHGIAAVVLGLGLAYLLVQAVFVLAFSPPPAIGWLGFGIVALVVVTVSVAVGQVLERSQRD